MSTSRVHPVAQPDGLGVRDKSLDERVGNRLDEVDALGRRADLAGVEEAGPGDAGHGHVEVGVGKHDARVDAAELEVGPCQPRRRLHGDARSDRRRAGECDARHLRMFDQRVARFSASAR